MFELPSGMSPKEDFEAALDMADMPFKYGVVTWSAARSKKAIGHQLISGSKVVGWLCSSENKDEVVVGSAAASLLRRIAHDRRLRPTAAEWTREQFAAVAKRVPQAIVDRRDLAAFGITGRECIDLSSRDLSMIVQELALRPEVIGAFAFEDGVIIADAGELPAEAEQMAIKSTEGLSGMASMQDSLSLSGFDRLVLWLDGGVLLLANAGSATLGLWTTPNADHQHLIANAAAMVDLAPEPMIAPEIIPEGFLMRAGKAGVDSMITMLRTGLEEKVNGYLLIEGPGEKHEIIIRQGMPVAIRSRSEDLQAAVFAATTPGFGASLRRIERNEIAGAIAGGLDDFSLNGFITALATCRTRSDSRQQTLRGRMARMWGFEAGLEALDISRVGFKLIEHKAAGEASLKPVESENTVLLPVSRHQGERAAKLETELDESRIQTARLKDKMDESVHSAEVLRDELRLANDRCDELHERIEGLNISLDESAAAKRGADENSEEVSDRASRLSKRVAALEHQLEQRASELALALGDSGSRSQLRKEVAELSTNEAHLSAEVEANSEKLTRLRDEIENDERRSRMLTDQVSALSDRHRVSATDTDEMERRLSRAREELTTVESETHEVRKMLKETLNERDEVRAKSNHLQVELRDLMGERQSLLRELGDLAANRGEKEGELSHLIKRARELSGAHEDALADIAEAERIRARLSEEPLARALMGEESGIEALGPVLERLEHARTMGYSVTLLDRAVERGLQLIQFTVEEVSRTPRYLLSNEVMDILERQSPHTAGTVRGLTNWSVKQRLENRLAETVQHVVLDLERMLEDYEQSITMLRRLRQVLDQLQGLGAPTEEVETLLLSCNRPESLPLIARKARRLIQMALDEIYLEADQRDAGAAVRLETTTQVLEELVSQIEATGLTGEDPNGPLWDFQRSGMLPWEAGGEAPHVEVAEDAIVELTQPLESTDIITEGQHQAIPKDEETEELWTDLPPPEDNPETETELVPKAMVEASEIVESTGEADQRAWIEQELARLDAQWKHRGEVASEPTTNPLVDEGMLSDLESDLADLEL